MALVTFDLDALEADPLTIAPAIAQVLETSGAFAIVNHGIPERVIADGHDTLRQFSLGPEEYRQAVRIDQWPAVRGYFVGEPIASSARPAEESGSAQVVERKYQAFEIGFETKLSETEPVRRIFHMENVWPQTQGFREAMEAYYRSAISLGHRLSRLLALALGQNADYFIQQATAPLSQMRGLYYPGTSHAPEQDAALGAHTDYEVLTVISSSTGGLDVLERGGERVEAQTPAEALIVLAGDVVEVLSNGVFRAARHRVRQQEHSRTSLIFFYGLDYDSVLTPMDKFREVIGVERFPVLRFGEHLVARAVANYPHLRRMVEAGTLVIPFECDPRNPLNAIRAKFQLE